MTLQEVGDTIGLSRQRVKQILDAHGGDLPKEERWRRACAECGERYPNRLREHQRDAHGIPWGDAKFSHLTPEREMRDAAITEDYLAGVSLVEISKRYRAETTDAPLTYMGIYRAIRRNGVEPDRGGGKYTRTPESLAKLSASQKRRFAIGPKDKSLRRGWRADE